MSSISSTGNTPATPFSFSKATASARKQLRALVSRITGFVARHFLEISMISLSAAILGIGIAYKINELSTMGQMLLPLCLLFSVFKPGTSLAGKQEALGKDLVSEFREKLEESQTAPPPVFYREKETQRLIAALNGKRISSAFITGPAGCGKTELVKCLVQMIAQKDERLPKITHNWEIRVVQRAQIESDGGIIGTIQGRMLTLIQHLKTHPNTKLFIDEAHTLNGAGLTQGNVSDLRDTLKPFLGGR